MRVEGAVAALFISCVVALADDTKPIDFSGDWWNSRCGLATLVEQGSLLSGVYMPSSGLEVGRKLPLTGFRSGIDFVWFASSQQYGPHHGVGWSAYRRKDRRDITHWLQLMSLTKEDAELYKSILAGAMSLCALSQICEGKFEADGVEQWLMSKEPSSGRQDRLRLAATKPRVR